MNIFFFLLITTLFAHTPEEIDEHRKTSDLTIVEYMSDSCSFCKKIEDEIQQTIKDLELIDGVKMFQINCKEHKEYCERDGVKSYPTIIPIRNNFMYKELLRPRECWNWKLQILELLHIPIPEESVGKTKHKN